MLDEWFQTAPYQSAFCVTAFKATLADFITQSKEQQAFNDLVKAEEDEDFAGKGESKFLLVDSVVPFDEEVGAGQVKVAKMQTIVEYDAMSYVEISKPSKQIVCDEFQCVEIEPEPEGLCLSRLGTFFLYGGLYQGCVQHWLFNEMYPIWFGEGTDVATVAIKVLFDQFVLTPFLCLPVCYLVKALVFSKPLREGLENYVEDAKRDLLWKYWLLWGPVQCLTFTVVPTQWRVPFIAFVSFFWLLVLSTITSRQDVEGAAAEESLVRAGGA